MIWSNEIPESFASWLSAMSTSGVSSVFGIACDTLKTLAARTAGSACVNADERLLLISALHGCRLLLQAGSRRVLRRDQGEVADEGDEEQHGRHERDLSRLRQAREAGGHDAPFPLRMLATIVKLTTFWPETLAVVLLWSWTSSKSGTTESRSRSRATLSWE